MTLTEFLLARIAEDEAVASAATPGPWQWWNLEGADQGWSDNGPTLETVARGPVYSDGSQGAAEDIIGAWGHDAWGLIVSEADAAHIARYDPARVLADCKAKRRIVHEWRTFKKVSDERAEGTPLPEVLTQAGIVVGLERAVEALALTYAGHPDYREEWRP